MSNATTSTTEGARTTAARTAVDLGRARNEEERARIALQFMDRFWEAPPLERATMVALAPGSSRSRHWDAFLAALIEHLCLGAGISSPTWTSEPRRHLARQWFPSALPRVRKRALEESPAVFRRHGVFITEADLLSA